MILARKPSRGRACALLALSTALLTTSPIWALSPGDIAIIGYQSTDPDQIAFVALTTIPSGEVIRFTDDGWFNTNAFRANEGGIQFTAAATIPAGTVISQPNPFTSNGWGVNNTGLGSGGFSLATAGDQIFAFQGNATTPSFIYGLNFNTAGWVATATSSNDTALPPTLTDGTTALNSGVLSNSRNGYYNGTTSGTPAQLLAAIATPANWVTSATIQTWPNWSFNVTSSFPTVTSVSLPAGPYNVGDSAMVTVQLSAVPAAGFPATVSVTSPAFTVSPVNVVISDPNSSGTANVTMGTGGTYTAVATGVDHATGTATSASFTVNAPPTDPTALAGPDRTLNFSGGSLAILMTDATANDPNGLSGLTYAWTPTTGSGIVSWANRTGSVTDPTSPADAQVTVNATGIYTFTLTVTDPTNRTAFDSVSITVVNAPPQGQYDPPPNYYAPAMPGGVWLTDGALKSALNGIVAGHTVRSYDAMKQALQILDIDPANSAHVILVYTGASVPKPWDGGVTWNREHLWPQSLFPNTSNMVSDEFNLRPCDPVVNSTRGNDPYGTGAGYWDPDHGAPDRGDCARSLFYDATAYMNDVTLVNGQPGANEMGDLAKLLEWHYSDPVNETERRRNHLIYSSTDNPGYFQANRNPYIDHPELVWTIFSGSSNNSRLYVGATNPPTGASTATINLGRIVKNAAIPPAQSVTLNKTGSNPTTYDILIVGSATTSTAGPRQTFIGGTQSRTIDAGLSTTTSSAGFKTGTITIDNTDVSSAGAGLGSADGDDVITITLTVDEHANASFASPADQNTLTIDFGSVSAGSTQTRPFTIYDLEAAPGFTAALDLDSIGGSGDVARLSTNVSTPFSIAAGASQNYTATLDTSTAGTYSATYTIANSDENIPGAAPGASLTLTLLAVVTPTACTAADANCDNAVNLADMAAFIDQLINATAPCSACAADMNADGLRDGRDIGLFVQAVLGP